MPFLGLSKLQQIIMWIKKTNEELRKKETLGIRLIRLPFKLDMSSPVKGFLYVFISFFIFQIVIEQLFGVSSHSRLTPGPPHNIKIGLIDIPNRLPTYFKLSLYIGIAFFLLSLYKRKYGKDKESKRLDYVCEKCNKLKPNDGIYTCECGGEYTHIDKMKWVEQ